MAKESGDRKKEKKERKRREAAEELDVKEKKISKKHKSESKKSEEPQKSKKKSKKVIVEEEEEEEKPRKKSKESKKKHKTSEESEKPETEIVPSDVSHVPVAAANNNNNESDLDFEYDKEDIKHLLESYSKEELVNLIYKTGEKGSRLFTAVIESANRDSSKRNIFVRGLGWDTTHENLKAAFEVYGEIEECSVVMDKDTGRAKGYGFVLFKTRKGAREALRNPEKRMYNRTVSCNLATAKPLGAGKTKEPAESVKIDLTRTANQSELAFPGLDLPHGHGNLLDNGHQQQQNMPMYAGPNMPFFGHTQPPPGFNPMYGPMMGNQAALMGNQMVPGMPNYRMFGSGMMSQGAMMPPNHMGMMGQYAGEGNGVGPGFEGERAWLMR